MPISIRHEGQWKTVQAVWIRDGGQWKQVEAMWVGDGGQWKRVDYALNPVSGLSVSEDFTNCPFYSEWRVQVTHSSSGTIRTDVSADNGTTWDQVDQRTVSGAGSYDVLTGATPGPGYLFRAWSTALGVEKAIQIGPNYAVGCDTPLSGPESLGEDAESQPGNEEA
jgi:hypothetical protein